MCLIVFMAQRKKIYQALIHTQYLLVDTFTVGLAQYRRFDEHERKSPAFSFNIGATGWANIKIKWNAMLVKHNQAHDNYDKLTKEQDRYIISWDKIN